MIVAIDGTVCAGKSTIAKRLAKALGFLHINTGAIYRAVTIKCVRRFGMDVDAEEQKSQIIDYIIGTDTKIDEEYKKGEFVVSLDGEDVTAEINLPYVSQRVSQVAKIPEIRELARKVQKHIASNNDCVIEGRDIGTVVFPNAEVKFYMSADDMVRAQRRMADYHAEGKDIPVEEVLKEIRARDKSDMEREVSPLKPADDSIIVDNSGDDADEMVEQLKAIVLTKRK